MNQKLRFILIILAGLFVLPVAKAQYTTPGNNLSLTLQDLVGLSGGVVTVSGGDYFINNTLVIAASDTLKILEAATIRTAATIRIEVLGKFISDPVAGQVVFTAQDTTSAATNFRGFRFEGADPAVFRNTVVKYGGGIQLIGTEALFEYSVFRNNGFSNVSAAITYSNSSPVIRYCEFRENARSALASGANVLGSPHIMYSTFIHNTTDNSNRPQINLGPGAADTLYIVGNYLEGLYTVVGGIAVSNLLGGGSTKAVIADNIIVGNRYGYAQTGNNISSVVRGNIILDNNIQGNPMQGGSGLNFNGNNTAIVRDNLISGNLWGVTLQGVAQPNFGTAQDHGGNVIYGNENGGQTHALYNNTPNPITAIGNYWGTNSPTVAEQYITHQPDDGTLGLVTYLPIMELHPVINSFSFLAEVNDALENDVAGVINAETHQVTVYVPEGTNVAQLIPHISISLGVTIDPDSTQPQDFSGPVEYTLAVPHGDEQVWTVTVLVQEPETYTVTFIVTGEDEELITNAVITLHGEANEPGDYVFENILPGTYSYSAALEGYNTAEGSVVVVDEDVEEEVVLSPETFTLTFSVNDAEGNPVGNAVITLNDEESDEGEYVFENLLPGIYEYEIAADGYHPVSGSVEIVDEDVTLDIMLELVTYTLSFTVNDTDGNPVANAVITLNDEAFDEGEYAFEDLLPGIYNYTVAAVGYLTVSGSVEIVDEDVTVDITLELLTYTLTFVVNTEDGDPVPDAMITLNGVQHSMGEYVFTGLLPGSYSWEADADGFKPAQGTVEIVDADVEVVVELEFATGIAEAGEMPFRIYPNPASEHITIANPHDAPAEVWLTTLNGKVLHRASLGSGEHTLSTGHLPAGIYLLRIVAGQNVYVQKVSVIR